MLGRWPAQEPLPQFFRGPDMTLFPTEQVFMNADDAGNVRFIARMSIVNRALSECSGTVLKEQIHVTVGGLAIEHHWQYFVRSNPLEKAWLRIEADAHPVLVAGRSSVSHETWFAPRTDDCVTPGCDRTRNYVEWDRFLESLAVAAEIRVRTVAVTDRNGELSALCIVQVDAQLREVLAKRRWHSPPCKPI
jgi:hypothetical protein